MKYDLFFMDLNGVVYMVSEDDENHVIRTRLGHDNIVLIENKENVDNNTREKLFENKPNIAFIYRNIEGDERCYKEIKRGTYMFDIIHCYLNSIGRAEGIGLEKYLCDVGALVKHVFPRSCEIPIPGNKYTIITNGYTSDLKEL